jgi:hypothetical protein
MEETAKPTPSSKKRWLLKLTGIIALPLIILVLVAPSIIAKTGLRDKLLIAILDTPTLLASTEAVTFG